MKETKSKEHKFLDLEDKPVKSKKIKTKKVVEKKTTNYILILDRSGSMQPISKVTLDGVMENIQTIQELKKKYEDQNFTISLVLFNNDIEYLYWFLNAEDVEPITVEKYSPHGSTFLYHTVGHVVEKVKNHLGDKLENIEEKNIVSIFTDGHDTSWGSGDYKVGDIAELTKELSSGEQWTFTYMGANHDVYEYAKKMNIPQSNTNSYVADKDGTCSAFYAQSQSISNYSLSRSMDKSVIDNFYKSDKAENKDEKKSDTKK